MVSRTRPEDYFWAGDTDVVPPWLSSRDRDWLQHHGYFLDAVWVQFARSGGWPEPVEVLRELRATDPSRRVTTALDQMPPVLARRDYAPPQVVLSIFGLGCCEGAKDLMGQYLEVGRLALRRFDSPQLPNRLTRADVVKELGLDEVEANRLSQIVMNDAPFLCGGEASIESWDREIDPRVEEFEDIQTVEGLLAFLAAQRRVDPQRNLASGPALLSSPPLQFGAAPHHQVHTGPPPTRADNTPTEIQARLTVWPSVVSALAAVLTLLISVFPSPSILGLALVGLFVGLSVALIGLQHRPVLAIASIATLIVAGAAIGALLEQQPDNPHYYFVISTGRTDAMVPRVEPRSGAVMVRDQVLGTGSRIKVICLIREEGTEWAKLVEGSFVRSAFLSLEVGSDAASSC
jgi:hypothetical protein